MRIDREAQVLNNFLGKIKHTAQHQLNNKQEGLVMARGDLLVGTKTHQCG